MKDDRWAPLDDAWRAAAGAGCALAALASPFTSPVTASTSASTATASAASPSPAPPAPPAPSAPSAPSAPIAPSPATVPRAPHIATDPSPPGTDPSPPAPAGLVALAAAHPYASAFLMGAAFTGSCLAGAAAATYAFKRGARGAVAIAPGDARLELQAMLRDVLVQSKSAAAAASAAKAEAEAAKTQAQALAPDIVSLTPLATHLAELDYKVAAGAAGQRKILAGIDALRETQRAELLTLQGEVRDQLVETAKMVGAGHEQMRQRQEAAAAVSEGVANNVKRVLEMLERAEKREAAAAAAKEDAANAEAKPAPEPEPEPDATVMDVNVDDSVAQIAATPPDVHADTRAAIDEMIAEVKAAEPQLAERLGAASAEWMMVQAVKAAEPYLSDGAGSAAAKLLRAVKAAEPFASRRIAAANAMWNIVLTVKEAEPRVERKAIHPAEYEILRAVKAAEPYLVQDLDMGGTASKLLRAVKGAEPRRPRFGAERAAAQMLKTAKWSEPVLRRPPGEASAGAGASPAQTKGKTFRRVMANCSPLEDAHASTSSLAPSEATPNAPNARARRPSTQPVRNLGVTDSGEWHFTLLAPLERTDARDGLQIQSCEIMLSREAHRSWAGDLFSLWHASHETCWTVGPFTTALLLNPDVDMVVLDGGWWRVSRDGDVYTVRERVAEDA